MKTFETIDEFIKRGGKIKIIEYFRHPDNPRYPRINKIEELGYRVFRPTTTTA